MTVFLKRKAGGGGGACGVGGGVGRGGGRVQKRKLEAWYTEPSMTDVTG